ncbi:MAG TPA: PEFG-CTERM sorting domain-containing protein [Nitrosopumilaceae archaeon]|nr:PEFG-CTERM sorting domain-containing protein [Nitrosopumilaceae archaeon]
MQIIGTTAIPEFQTIAIMILMISIIPIVLVSKLKNSGFRY